MSSTITALTSGGGLAMAGDTSGQLELKTNNGTTAVTIDTSQNVGIGTSSPATKLTVKAATNVNMNFNTGNTASNARMIALNDAGNSLIGMELQASTHALLINASDGLRVDSSGNVLLGTTSQVGGVSAKIGAIASSSLDIITARCSGATAGKYWSVPYMDNSSTLYIMNQGSVGVKITDGATSWSAQSDARLKDVTGKYTNALADIAQIEPVKFTWKNDETKKPCVGVLAQSVIGVVPEAVDAFVLPKSEDTTEYLNVRYTELIPLLIASIQELNAKVTALEEQVINLGVK